MGTNGTSKLLRSRLPVDPRIFAEYNRPAPLRPPYERGAFITRAAPCTVHEFRRSSPLCGTIMDGSVASLCVARARSCSRVAVCAHDLALEAVLSPHRTASARSAGRHLFKSMMNGMPLLIFPRPWRAAGSEHFSLVTYPGEGRILRPHLRCARAAPRTIAPHAIPLRISILHTYAHSTHMLGVCGRLSTTRSSTRPPWSRVGRPLWSLRWAQVCGGGVAAAQVGPTA